MTDRRTRPPGPLRPSVGVRELRAELATHLARVEAGETLIVERGGRPVARLTPVSEPPNAGLGYGLEDLARLGLVEPPRSGTGSGPAVGADSSITATARPLPVDVRVDRIVRQVRG